MGIRHVGWCKGKIKYMSLASAEAQMNRSIAGHLRKTGAIRKRPRPNKGIGASKLGKAKESTKADVLRYSVYQCETCGFYHLGRMTNAQIIEWEAGTGRFGTYLTEIGPPSSWEEVIEAHGDKRKRRFDGDE